MILRSVLRSVCALAVLLFIGVIVYYSRYKHKRGDEYDVETTIEVEEDVSKLLKEEIEKLEHKTEDKEESGSDVRSLDTGIGSESSETGGRVRRKKFVATHEWQPVEDGQALPPGLHIRVNLMTGEKEARLLEDSDRTTVDNSLALVPVENETDDVDRIDDDNWKIGSLPSEKEIKKITKKFRSYDQIKEELSEVKMGIKSELEVLTGLVKEFLEKFEECKIGGREEEAEAILTDLENLVHQGDNAEEFVEQNGVYNIVIPCLENNTSSIKIMAARILGSSVQNNPTAKNGLMQTGVLSMLLRALAVEEDFEVKCALVYAVSCLSRSSPTVQQSLVDNGGLSIFTDLLEQPLAEDKRKLQLKVVAFISDLLQEKLDVTQTLTEQKSPNVVHIPQLYMDGLKKKLELYEEISLEQKVKNQGWCVSLPGYLIKYGIKNSTAVVLTDAQNLDDAGTHHETVEVVTNAIAYLADACEDQFHTVPSFFDNLLILTKYYGHITTLDDVYYASIFNKLRELCLKFKLLPE